jgi:hypothetical protein
MCQKGSVSHFLHLQKWYSCIILRSFSAYGKHVGPVWPAQMLRPQHNSVYRWYLQRRNPLIETAGEIRVWIENARRIVKMIVTKPYGQGLIVEELHRPSTLEELWRTRYKGYTVSLPAKL